MILKTHHVGIVVKDLAAAIAQYVGRFGYEIKTEIIHDPVQTAYVQFLQLPGDPVYLELVSPDGPTSRLSNALNRGNGLNHLCYATEDIEGAFRELRGMGLFSLRAPVPAVAFGGRRIAWLMGQDQVPIELVETRPADHELFGG